MLAKFRSAVSKLRVRQREAARRQTQRRTLRAEPLEGRLLLSGDSWVVPTGIPTSNLSRFVATDSAGSVYVAATRDDGAATSPDICLKKYSPDGQELVDWTIDLRLADYQTVSDLAVDDDGVYIVGGFSGIMNLDPKGGANGVLESRGGTDAYLAKYDPDSGAFLWAHQWGGTRSDFLLGVAVSQEGVFVTGQVEVSIKTRVRTDLLVASVSSDGVPGWSETVPNGLGRGIAVYTPPSAPTQVYVSGDGKQDSNLGPVVFPPAFVAKFTAIDDGQPSLPDWTFDLGENTYYANTVRVGIDDSAGPTICALTRWKSSGGGLLVRISETGVLQWSTSMTSSDTQDAGPLDFSVKGNRAYVVGYFKQPMDLDGAAANPLLVSRGLGDSFLARYDVDNGRLMEAQRFGGHAWESWPSVAVDGGYVYAVGSSTSTDGDFPASLPGQMSAFVPGDSNKGFFALRLDVAAPIVQVAETDITVPSVPEGTSVTLSATATAGNIVWYENGEPLPGQADHNPVFTVTLSDGVHLISAIATELVTVGAETVERVGMAGVVVTVTGDTKFYVVDANSASKTFEYDESGTPVESYSLNTANTAPRGAASTIAGDKTWVVDNNRKVYVYNNSGGLLGSWTAGTLSTKAKVEGITVHDNDVWIVDDYSNKVYRYANGALANNVTLTAAASPIPLNSANTTPKDIVTDGTSLWVVNDSTTDMVFKYTLSGTLLGSWTINGGGGSPTGITLDPSNASPDLWIVDNGTDKVYQYADGRNAPFGTQQSATMTFALASGNTNPQGIADPPAPSSLLTTDATTLAEPVSEEAALVDHDAALENMYYEPQRKVRVDRSERGASRNAVVDVRVPDYTVGAAPNYLTGDNRWATDRDSQADVDDLFAEWDSDPLALVSVPDLGM